MKKETAMGGDWPWPSASPEAIRDVIDREHIRTRETDAEIAEAMGAPEIAAKLRRMIDRYRETTQDSRSRKWGKA